MGKITRVRTGCWTCKERHRKCDEGKPFCNNCFKSNRQCAGYGIRLSFDVDDNRNSYRIKKSGKKSYSFIGKPKTSVTKKKDRIKPTITSYEIGSNLSSDTRTNSFLNIQKKENNLTNDLFDENSVSVNKIESFSSQLYECLEYLMKDPELVVNDRKVTNDIIPININSYTDLGLIMSEKKKINSILGEEELLDIAAKYKVFSKERDTSIDSDSLINLTYQEENMMLKHFFKKLLPLLDGHPKTPWPDLALQYCDFSIARSCFISLACIHIYESGEGGSEYYQKGIAHIDKTMNYLLLYINSIKSNIPQTTIQQKEEFRKRQQISSFVILVLVNVNIMFIILHNGTSYFSRFFFKVFGLLCEDQSFYEWLKENDKKMSIVSILSWFDTISAIVSPDCRLPFCSPNWYGKFNDTISTAKMMACPGEIFTAMSKVCLLRHDLKYDILKDYKMIEIEYNKIKGDTLKYRDYVLTHEDGTESFTLRLKGAQCWSLAILITLERTVKLFNWKDAIKRYVHEFIDTYGSMNSHSAVVTQMVWPVFAVGCECNTVFEKEKLSHFMETLYQTSQMGTLYSLKKIVEKVWETGQSQEKVLLDWLEEGSDYLPL